jgi:hypothetical protein
MQVQALLPAFIFLLGLKCRFCVQILHLSTILLAQKNTFAFVPQLNRVLNHGHDGCGFIYGELEILGRHGLMIG